jgi:MATE family multidrug resistance protein
MNRKTIRSIITIGAPLLAGNLATYLMKAIDLAMLGRLGTETLAAAGIATLSTSVLYTFMWPVSLGVQALASRRYGRQTAAPREETDQRRRETAWVLSNGVIAGWISISIALVLSTLIEPILSALLGNPTIVALAMEYVRVLRWSIVVLSVGMAHRGFFGAINRTGIVMAATVIGNLLNVFLNYTFIFGNFGAPAWGLVAQRWVRSSQRR